MGLPVDADSRALAPADAARNYHVDSGRANQLKTPEARGAAVAEQCLRAAGQNGRHPPSPLAYLRPADCVDAPPKPVQTTPLDSVLDRIRVHPAGEELGARDHTMLATG